RPGWPYAPEGRASADVGTQLSESKSPPKWRALFFFRLKAKDQARSCNALKDSSPLATLGFGMTAGTHAAPLHVLAMTKTLTCHPERVLDATPDRRTVTSVRILAGMYSVPSWFHPCAASRAAVRMHG